MESFVWDECFVTGVASVDAQHQRLVDVINRVGDLRASGAAEPGTRLEPLLDELTEYTRYHFDEEERLMSARGLDARHVEGHRAAHIQFVAELAQARALLIDCGRADDETMKFLVHWLAFHILGTDQSMARQIVAIDAGRDAAAAFTAEEEERATSTGPLLRALGGLFLQVSNRNRELSELNRTLEARVAARTAELTEANRRLEALALTDALTGLPNRRHALSALEERWQIRTASNPPVACLMIDADGFKPINDAYGHAAGDAVLRELARALRHAVRTDDLVARLGGDEFLVVCPRTDLEGARRIGEKVREAVASLRVPVGDDVWQGSISVGVAVRQGEMSRPEDLVQEADGAVYRAKRDGRNCVRGPEGPPER